jgi:hypothetical protein
MKIEDVKIGEKYRYIDGGAMDGGYPGRIGEVCTVTQKGANLFLVRFPGDKHTLAVYASELEPITNEKEN